MVCPTCQSTNIISAIDSQDQVWGRTYDVAYCKECGLYFLQDIPSIDEIKGYYETKYYNYTFSINLIKKMFRNFRCKNQFDYIKKHISDKNKLQILEIGCGEGTLLNLFQKNHAVFGLEYNSKTRDMAYKNFKIETDSTDLLEFKTDNKYDLIIMSHVLEHFTDIKAVMHKCKDLLSENGHIFIEVPSAPDPALVEKNELHVYLETPHIFNFSPKSLQRFVTNYDFKVLSFDRVYYNLRFLNDAKSKVELGKMFMTGRVSNLKFLLAGLIYIVNSVVVPKNSWSKLDLNSDWYGVGECMRIIIKK